LISAQVYAEYRATEPRIRTIGQSAGGQSWMFRFLCGQGPKYLAHFYLPVWAVAPRQPLRCVPPVRSV